MILAETDPQAVTVAAAALLAGTPIVIPTDTVYGLAAAPFVPGALDELFDLKARPRDRSIAVLAADLAQAAVVAELSARERLVAQSLWPGALTLVLDRRSDVEGVGAADGTVGVRCPDDDFTQALLAQVGPLAVTSANRSGSPTPHSAGAAANGLVRVPGLIIDGGIRQGQASTVAAVGDAGHGVRIYRDGPISVRQIEALLVE